MRALAITPGQRGSARVLDHPDPTPGPGECLVRVLEVGIDATDREIHEGLYGEAPSGDEVLILGHESVGRLERVPRSAAAEGLREGDLVVATVRRPCPEMCLNCRHGEVDFCLTGDYRERGIKGLHGFLAERYAESAAFLVPVPAELRELAVLLEPISVVEKAFRQVALVQRRAHWAPHRVLVTGAGTIGVLAAMLARLRGLEVVVYSRGAQEGATARALERIEVGYVDSERESMEDAARRHGAPDIVVEATGYSPFAWQSAQVLAPNGIACLLSVTSGDRDVELPSDRLNSHLVLGNRTVFGSVNANRVDFDQGLLDLGRIAERWPGVFDGAIERPRGLEAARAAVESRDRGALKTAIVIADEGHA